MLIRENISLKNLNTFRLEAKAAYYSEPANIAQLQHLLQTSQWQNLPRLILGGGSNILFAGNFNGLVVKISYKGIEIAEQNPRQVYLKIMAGENWDNLVTYCVQKGWGGIENLTMIPGNTGTSPIQNIGAYGVELKDVFHSLEALDTQTGNKKTFYSADCQFGYRDSYFKNEGKQRYIILSVTLCLTRKEHQLRYHYHPLTLWLEKENILQPGIRDIMQAVRHIRQSKLPDPDELGNAGSFFKNPLVQENQYDELRQKWPDIPGYPDKVGMVKLAAGWLIEKAGLRGFREGDAGVHRNQALVLVNYGNATGRELLQLATRIQQTVREKFDVVLQPEVNIID